MPKAMIITVGTGRDGKDIAGALSLSIKQQHPDFVFFLASELSNAGTVPLIEKENIRYEVDIFHEENDIEEIYLHYLEIIKQVIEKGYPGNDIVVDYTSGTKSMSAALFAAGIALEIGSLNYIAGKRDITGRVIPGTERPLSIAPHSIFAEIKIKEAQELFNRFQFQAALLLLGPIKEEIKDASVTERVDFLLKLIEAYALWDTFKLQEAVNHFGKINAAGLMNNHPAKNIFLKNLALIQKGNANRYSIQRLVDLLHNIYRRMQEGKYDDAQARIYRLFEYMAQIKLYQDYNKIETERVKISSLPTDLRPKYDKMAGHKPEVQLSMVRVFELLADLKDELGMDFMKQYIQDGSTLRKLLNRRNKSILAHGFKAIEKEDCEKLIEITKDFLNKYFSDWSAEQEKAVFPKL